MPESQAPPECIQFNKQQNQIEKSIPQIRSQKKYSVFNNHTHLWHHHHHLHQQHQHLISSGSKHNLFGVNLERSRMPRGACVRPESHSHSPKTIFPRSVSCLLLLVFLHSSRAQPQDEALALIQFRSSLVDPDFVLSSWNPATSPCSGERSNWVGIQCYNGYVWGLQLERMNLRGQIDVDALHNLHFMRAISLMGNSFDGPMPDWRNLGGIKALYLSDNQFSGELPADAFKGLYSLKKVYMANNKLTGPLPTSLELPKLIELRMENNQFSGWIPKISSQDLEVVDLSNNLLEGPVPVSLSKMDPASFAGNKALCGEPLGTQCDPTVLAAAAGSRPSRKFPFALFFGCILLGILILFLVLFLLRRHRHRNNQTPQPGKPMPEPLPATIDVEKNNHNQDHHKLPAPLAAPHSEAEAVPAKRPEQQQQPSAKLSFVEETRQKFDLQDLMKASAEVLGSGSFGASYKAVMVDGEALVVKRFKVMNGITREDFHEHMRRLGRLKHPNLLPLVAYLFRREEKLLVSDFVFNGNLATLLHGKHSAALKWGSRLKIIKGVAKGLIYLHNQVPTIAVPHAHLKSSNVLLDRDYNPLLMDYALLPLVNPAHAHQILLVYKSPESAQHGRVSRKTDVWCFGTLILEILTGRYLPHGAGADLAAWVNGIAAEDPARVFDKDLAASTAAASRRQMEKMLRVGILCCKEDAERRWDLEEAVRRIERDD